MEVFDDEKTKDTDDFRKGADVFREYFKNGAPSRMTFVTEYPDLKHENKNPVLTGTTQIN